jgi:hypothetical protein
MGCKWIRGLLFIYTANEINYVLNVFSLHVSDGFYMYCFLFLRRRNEISINGDSRSLNVIMISYLLNPSIFGPIMFLRL